MSAAEIRAVLESPGGQTLLFGLLTVWPLARTLRRLGRSPWGALLVFVPIAGLVLVLAHAAWPLRPARPPAAGAARPGD